MFLLNFKKRKFKTHLKIHILANEENQKQEKMVLK